MLDSLAARLRRSVAELPEAAWPTKQERPLQRWSKLSVQVAETGMPEGTSGPLEVLLAMLRPRRPATAPVEEATPLPETSAWEWLAVSWAPSSSAWKAMMSEALTVAQWPEASTAWRTMERMAHHFLRLPPFSLLVKVSMEAVLDFSMALRQATTLLER